MRRPYWEDYNIKILKSIQLLNIILYCCDIKIVLWHFQVQVRSYLFSVCSIYTDICLNLCDPKGSRPDEAYEV